MPPRREATEIDVRITFHVTDEDIQTTAQAFVEFAAKPLGPLLTYGLISNVEKGSSSWNQDRDGPGLHVHGAFIFTEPVKLWTLKSAFKQFEHPIEIYMVVRNVKYPYKSWIMHHNKQDTKLGSNVPLWVHGKLPTDNASPGMLRQIIRMGKKFGFDVAQEASMLRSAVQPTVMDRDAREKVKLVKLFDQWAAKLPTMSILDKFKNRARFLKIERTMYVSVIHGWEQTNGRHPIRFE